MHSSASSRSTYVSIAVCLFLAGCPPTAASCPTGFELASDGRCVASTDGGTGGDGAVGTDTGVMPMVDAGTGPDGCALHAYYEDADGDGYGDAASTMFACEMPTGYAATGDDCDDSCATCHPGATEVCEGALDEDCDGTVDQASACSCTTGQMQPCGASSTAPCHMGTQTCAGGTWGACTGNVDPTAELCNGVDDDCNGSIDDGITIPTWHVDADGDGHGSATGTTMMACTMPTGYVASSDDCDDSAVSNYPGNTEVCDGADNDCSGAPDDVSAFTCVRGSTGLACSTVCGSTGTGACSATCTSPTGAACTPPGESCNGSDDDCDGVADEGLSTVGAAVCAGTCAGTTSPALVSPHIVGIGGGNFAVVFTKSSQDQFYLQRIGADGTPLGAVIPLGTDAHPLALSAATMAVGFDGTNIVIVYTHEGSSDLNAYAIGVDPMLGGRRWTYTLPRPTGRNVNYQVRLTGLGPSRATVYVEQQNTAGTTHYVRRYRLNTAGSPTVIQQVDALSDLVSISGGGAWDAIATTSADLVVYRSATGLVMVSGPTGDATTGTFATVGTVQTSTQQPNVMTLALALRSPSSAVSASNPIGIAWQRDSANGTFIAQLASATSATSSTPAELSSSSGAPSVFGIPRWLELFPAQNASTYMNTGMFYVVSVEDDTTSSSNFVGSLHVWEAITNATSPSHQLLTTPGETSASRYDIGIAASGTTIRIAEQNATGQIVTRQLGCH